MTRIRKRKRRLRYIRCSFLLCVMTGLLYIGSATLLRGYNVSLQSKNQTLEDDICSLQIQKEALTVQVAELSSYERIVSIVGEEYAPSQDAIYLGGTHE